MAQETQGLTIAEFGGLVTNMSPYAGPPGATEDQVNLRIVSEGELIARQGMRELTFEN